MKKVILTSAMLCSVLFGVQEYEANLAGHIIIDSKSTVKPPKDAPDFFKTYGKFANIAREEKIGTFKSKGNRETGKQIFIYLLKINLYKDIVG